eukprot:7202667-Ditylum_brightwellii.AAC.1
MVKDCGSGYDNINNTNFCFRRTADFSLAGEVGIAEDNAIPNLSIDAGLEFSVVENEIFDDIAPVVTLPDPSKWTGIIQFTPENAIVLLRLAEAAIIEATRNKAFAKYNLPLLNVSPGKVLEFAKVFTERLYEFFVMVEPFEERSVKSLLFQGSEDLAKNSTTDSSLELYLIREELTVNPIPGNAAALRTLAEKPTSNLCNIIFDDKKKGQAFLDSTKESIT